MRLLLFLILCAAASLSLAQSVIRGPVVSAVTDSSARILLQLDNAAELQLEASTDEQFGTTIKSSTQNATPANYFFVTLDISTLAPSTKYYFRPRINGLPVSLSPTRSFTTFPSSGHEVDYTFVFGSCSRYDSVTRPSRVFELMQKDNPLFFLHIGDWDYPDYEVSQRFTDHDSTLARAYERKYLTSGGMDTLLMSCPVDYVYDDHDYIGNNSDGTWRTRDSAVRGYQKYFPHYDLPNPTGGIWHKFSAGNVDVFMLDLRSARSVDTNAYQLKDSMYVWEAKPGQSMLRGVVKGGEDQLTWFLRELKASTARWKFIMSSVNWNPGMRKQLPLLLAQANATKNTSTMRLLSDTWLGFIEEQDSIISFIKREGIKNVIFCSGDVHTAMMDDGANAVFPEIVSANLQNYNSNVYGQLKKLGLADAIWNRGGQVNDTLRTYGRITIKTQPKHAALLEIVDENGKVVTSYEVADSISSSAVHIGKFYSSNRIFIASRDKHSVMFTLELEKRLNVAAYIIDSIGKVVRQVLRGELPAGPTNVPVRTGSLASGAYQLIVEVAGSKLNQPFTVVK